MAAITASCAALRPAGVRVSAPRQARSARVVCLAKTEVNAYFIYSNITYLMSVHHSKWELGCVSTCRVVGKAKEKDQMLLGTSGVIYCTATPADTTCSEISLG